MGFCVLCYGRAPVTKSLGQRQQLCPSSVFPTPQGHPHSYQTPNPWLRCAVPHPGTLSLLPGGQSALQDHCTLVCITSLHPWHTHIPGIPGTNENTERHGIPQCLELCFQSSNLGTTLPHPAMLRTTLLSQQCLEPCYWSSNAWNHATQSSNGTTLHGPQRTMLPLPLLETRRHMLLGMFLLMAPEKYTEDTLPTRWEAQRKPLSALPFPVSPLLAFRDLPAGLGVCSGGQ